MVHPLIGRDTIEPQNSRRADNIETLRQWAEMMWDFVGDPSDEKLQQLELTPAEVSSNYIRCLREISRAIRVEFPKLQSRRLEGIGALQANQTQTQGS
ncbi:hypothetical protein TWF970_011062 [Orbilia oligospora]|uniref:Uncharacterized protein n=1 Tax=Orbilia oligospora TaxID=2813651 RepID=A0A7C8RIP9_ORBOL|nr:hypothetical protein TWF970_011062 [Orbilia oligospora]